MPSNQKTDLDEALQVLNRLHPDEGSMWEQAGPGFGESPTLAQLDSTRRPKARTVCETCPNSVWFASTTDLKCYCRVMYLVTWSTKEPNHLTACDGLTIGQDKG